MLHHACSDFKSNLPITPLTTSRTFSCKTYDAGADTNPLRVLAVDQSVDCDSDSYKLMLFYAIVMVVLFPGKYRDGRRFPRSLSPVP